jgi:hypothetical protein
LNRSLRSAFGFSRDDKKVIAPYGTPKAERSVAISNIYSLAPPATATYITLCDDFPIFEPDVMALRRACYSWHTDVNEM